ncbi:MAG: alpha-1,2-fucosyltransferase [Lachnospiraceae bacterium]|nr:alpha-1,2-fucosyltransferase [Lachnospiraceae bacterium]
MIIVRFTSGLGNQMFQYNLYSLLKEKYPQATVKADTRWFYTQDEHHGFELRRIFENVDGSGFSLEEATIREIFDTTGQIATPVKGALAPTIKHLLGPVNRKLREHGVPQKKGVVFDQLESPIDPDDLFNLDINKDYYIFGFFVEEIYYSNRVDALKKELVFPLLSGENEKLAGKMRRENSVSVHVRRGDYLSATYSDKFISLGMDYYRAAVDVIKEHITDPKFYIFSEDADYTRQAFEWLTDKTIVDINSGNDSYRDMQLMSMCKANIIANSTFSQWASILNENSEHITVYPAKYMADSDTEDRRMPGWIRI